MRIKLFICGIFISMAFVFSAAVNLHKECMDAQLRKIHPLESKWSPLEDCSLDQCRKIDKVNQRNTELAITVSIRCQNFQESDSKCKRCDKTPANNKLPFPDCCSKQVCICGSRINIFETDERGLRNITRKRAITEIIQPVMETTTLSTTTSAGTTTTEAPTTTERIII